MKRIAINYNDAGLGDLMRQLDFAHSLANKFDFKLVVEDYVCTPFGGINYTEQMGWDLCAGYIGHANDFELIDSSLALDHYFNSGLTKINFIYGCDHYKNLKQECFPYLHYFNLKHGSIPLKSKHCVIHLRMGEIRSYQTPFGKFHPHMGIFTKEDGRADWSFDYLEKVLHKLASQNFTVEIITDGPGAAFNFIKWRTEPIINDYGLSNKQIADLVYESSTNEINAIKSICPNTFVNEDFLSTVKRIMQASLLLYSKSLFVPMVYNNLMDIRKTQSVEFHRYLEHCNQYL